MDSELDRDPTRAIELCRESHSRLLRTVADLTDEVARSASRLPGWTVGHVLTHLARNAEGFSRRLDGALRGEEVRRYPGGTSQREADIEAGATRNAGEILADLTAAQQQLEQVMARSDAAGWPNAQLLAGDMFPTPLIPVRRVREVEMHHVDLGRGYEPVDWPEEYVVWELPMLLRTVPGRVQSTEDRRALTAWLAGRAAFPGAVTLDSW